MADPSEPADVWKHSPFAPLGTSRDQDSDEDTTKADPTVWGDSSPFARQRGDE